MPRGPQSSSERASSDLGDVAPRLRLAVSRIARRMRIEAGDGLGPTPSQMSALATLDKFGPLRIGELAVREQVTAPTMTRIVNVLQAGELVVRSVDSGDRRSWVVTLTPAGHTLVRKIRRDRTAFLVTMLAALPPEQLERLAGALPVLETLAGSDSPGSGGDTQVG